MVETGQTLRLRRPDATVRRMHQKVWCRNPKFYRGARLKEQALFPTRHARTGPAMEPCCAKWWPIIAAPIRSASRSLSRRFAASAAVRAASLTVFEALAFAIRSMVTLTVRRNDIVGGASPPCKLQA